jgi:hypothetical protein
MSLETFSKCMTLVKASDNPTHAGRKFVWLNHFGEPLLNPLLPDFIARATACNVDVSFSSNGVDYDRKMFPRSLWQRLADAGLRGVCLSAHARTGSALREHFGDIVNVFDIWEPKAGQFHDWAGQVDMSQFDLDDLDVPIEPCDYERHNMFAVTWEGRTTACCYDIEGSSRSIDDVLSYGFGFRPITLCSSCRLGRGDLDMLRAHGGF